MGRITAYTVASVCNAALDTPRRHRVRPIAVDASRLTYIDHTGIAVTFNRKRRERPAEAEIKIRGLAPTSWP